MIYGLAADAVVVLHAAFIAFAALGALLVLRWPRVAYFQLPSAAWGAAVELFGWVCPLTPLEQQLRALAGEASYSGGFVERYVVPVIYPAGLTPQIQLWLGVAVIAANAAIYGRIAWRSRQRGARAG